MRHLRHTRLATYAVLVACAAIGWLATGALQRTVAIAPGLESCWRLDGGQQQVDCASEQFRSGAEESAGSRTGAEREGAVVAYVRRAERLAADDQRLANVCHPAMHDIGRREGARAGRDGRVPEFPPAATQLCTAGYVHGLSEGYLAGTPDSDVAAAFPKLCHDPASRPGCAHGVGHALLRAQSSTGDHREAVAAATLRCGELPGESGTDCFDGVYMELAMRRTPRPVTIQAFVDTCTGASDTDQELSCWGYLDLSFASNDTPTAEVPGWCAKASVPGQFPCVEGYGRDLGAAKVAGCSEVRGSRALHERCIDGAVGLQVGSGHVSAKSASSACATLGDSAYVRYCRHAVGRYDATRARIEGT